MSEFWLYRNLAGLSSIHMQFNYSMGNTGRTNLPCLLGGLVLTSLGLAAYSRSDIPENSRRPFHIYADEVHNFATLSTASMMSEMRKYACSLTIANQYLLQLDKDIREAVLGNAGTLICFRVGSHDATYLQNTFDGNFVAQDIMRLANYDLCIKAMIDGMPSRAFSATTI